MLFQLPRAFSNQVWSGVFILSSYLLLFIAFYQKTYKSKKAAGDSHSNFIRTSKAAVSTAAQKDILCGSGAAATAVPAPQEKMTTRSRGASTPQLEKAMR